MNSVVTVLLCAVALLNAPKASLPQTDAQGHVGNFSCVDGVSTSRPSVTVKCGNHSFSYTDDYITPSDFTVADEIAARRINAPLEQKMELVDTYLKNGASHKTALAVSFPLLIRAVDKLAEKVYIAPVEAEVVYANGKFSVKEGANGRRLDEDRLYGSLYYSLKYGLKDAVTATAMQVKPETTAAQLKKELILRGEYTTEFYTSSAARAHNVGLALSKLDGARIKPGETLSFNNAVGERTEENGFKTAKVISYGKYVDGVGGGVCQASTAVYNAALIAGLKCTCNAHSICPSYCPPGLDAMISSVSDLTVKNDTDATVYISCALSRGKATVRVYGLKNEYRLVPESVVTKTVTYDDTEIIDSEHKYFSADAVSGDRLLVAPGKNGYESETYLNYCNDSGEMVKRVRVRTDKYKATPQITAVAP